MPHPLPHPGPSRRSVFALAAAALLPAACSGDDATPPAPTGTPTAATTGPAPATSAAPVELTGVRQLERATPGLRIGVHGWDTGTGRTVTHRADERFPMGGIYAPLLVARVLAEAGAGGLGRRMPGGGTLGEYCKAEIEQSDAHTGPLLADVGGPRALTAWIRDLGDDVTRLDRPEPDLHRVTPGDPRDSTSPAAIAGSYHAVIFGRRLGRQEQVLLRTWMIGTVPSGGPIREVAPADWTVGDKAGAAAYGTVNDVAILFPQDRPPILLAVLTTRATQSLPENQPVEDAARLALAALA